MLTRLRWFWSDLITTEREMGNFWDRYFLTMWLIIMIFEII